MMVIFVGATMVESKSIELLAPAGSPESLVAAVDSGASAVYLGLKQFNARGNAINFSIEELGDYVPFAHQNGTKVYLTLNTVVKMAEMEPILETLQHASDCGIDGVILQDLGLGRMIAKHFPNLRRHASTQLGIHNLEGVAFCVDQGFQRVVLARELTLTEIAEIRAAFPAEVIELEVFCHGAMCYTYSGMCFFSGSVGGRSGNRGECAYTCRKGYKIHNPTEFPMAAGKGSFSNYLFSMKDMNTLDLLPKLVDAGVDSLKIEGRRKGPAYVSASVKAYLQRLEGLNTHGLEKDLKLSFGRRYTQAFYSRGQFGDAPIDLTTTGTEGMEIGRLDQKGRFQLKKEGIQRHDGIRLVFPNRTEQRLSFNGYQVDRGDRMRPPKGSWIQLKTVAPEGTKVMWVQSQAVQQRYQPNLPKKKSQTSGAPIPTTMRVVVEKMQVNVALMAAGVVTEASIDVEPSHSGKRIAMKNLLYRFGDSQLTPAGYFGEETIEGFIPASKLKKLRRELIQVHVPKAAQARKERSNTMATQEARACFHSSWEQIEETFILRVDKLEQLSWAIEMATQKQMGIDFLMRPTISTPDWQKIVEALRGFDGVVRLVLPLVLRKWDLRLIRRRLEALLDYPFQWVLSNPGHLPLLKQQREAGKLIHSDFSIYHLNTWACNTLLEMGITGRLTLSLEDDFHNITALLKANQAPRFEAIAYTDTPLFIAEACSLAALYGGCPGTKTCGHETLHIENEHGDHFEVRHDRCRSTVIGKKALSWSGRLWKLRDLGVKTFRLDFTVRNYTRQEMEDIVSSVVMDQALAHTHSENFERVLL